MEEEGREGLDDGLIICGVIGCKGQNDGDP